MIEVGENTIVRVKWEHIEQRVAHVHYESTKSFQSRYVNLRLCFEMTLGNNTQNAGLTAWVRSVERIEL